jgi:hypothetical protein
VPRAGGTAAPEPFGGAIPPVFGDSYRQEVNMTTIRIDLPDPLAQTAKDAGLLEPQALEALISDELVRRRALEDLRRIADRLSPGGGLVIEEDVGKVVQGEIDKYRAEKRDRREGRR